MVKILLLFITLSLCACDASFTDPGDDKSKGSVSHPKGPDTKIMRIDSLAIPRLLGK
jgi:hypothetical protein